MSYVYPMVSMMTMVAPTPDWFVGVDSVNLCVLGKHLVSPHSDWDLCFCR